MNALADHSDHLQQQPQVITATLSVAIASRPTSSTPDTLGIADVAMRLHILSSMEPEVVYEAAERMWLHQYSLMTQIALDPGGSVLV